MLNKEYSRASSASELANVCGVVVPWYQAEVYSLAKSMSDDMDKTIIASALTKEGKYNEKRK